MRLLGGRLAVAASVWFAATSVACGGDGVARSSDVGGTGAHSGLAGAPTRTRDVGPPPRLEDVWRLPAPEQVLAWRRAAADPSQPVLQREALGALALRNDAQGVELCVRALRQPADHLLRGTVAQALAHYGSPAADAAKPALLAALAEAAENDRRQIAWALVVLGEKSVADQALALYRTGALTTVMRLRGGAAFDPSTLAKLLDTEALAALAGDTNDGVRELVARALADKRDPRSVGVLERLGADSNVAVACAAAAGLLRITGDAGRAPLVALLKSTDRDRRAKLLEVVRDTLGGAGLVLALDSVDHGDETREWSQYQGIFEQLRRLGDPGSAEPLLAWIEHNPQIHAHWRAEAALSLAEVGDVRAARYLAERMKLEPKDLYPKEKFWQADKGGHLSKSDSQRVSAARRLTELALLHPEARAALAADAGEAVRAWIAPPRPLPHANGLRFLAVVGYDQARAALRDWAFPSDPLPQEGAAPPLPAAWVVAQSALRSVGELRDEPSFARLTKELARKDPKLCITAECLLRPGMALLGMALRGVAIGASEGLGEWGDARAVAPLLALVEDKSWHAESRLAACDALAWCADASTLEEVSRRLSAAAASQDPDRRQVAACYAETLARRPAPAQAGALVALLRPGLDAATASSVARAIGLTELAPAVEAKLVALLAVPEMRSYAALALVLGGAPDSATRTVAELGASEQALGELAYLFYRAFEFWSDADLERGSLYRWADNARAISGMKLGADMTPQLWAELRLAAALDGLDYDAGPHSASRFVMRAELIAAARGGDRERTRRALLVLTLMKEQGSLMALQREPGETGELAAQALHELMFPASALDPGLAAQRDAKRRGGR